MNLQVKGSPLHISDRSSKVSETGIPGEKPPDHRKQRLSSSLVTRARLDLRAVTDLMVLATRPRRPV